MRLKRGLSAPVLMEAERLVLVGSVAWADRVGSAVLVVVVGESGLLLGSMFESKGYSPVGNGGHCKSLVKGYPSRFRSSLDVDHIYSRRIAYGGPCSSAHWDHSGIASSRWAIWDVLSVVGKCEDEISTVTPRGNNK